VALSALQPAVVFPEGGVDPWGLGSTASWFGLGPSGLAVSVGLVGLYSCVLGVCGRIWPMLRLVCVEDFAFCLYLCLCLRLSRFQFGFIC